MSNTFPINIGEMTSEALCNIVVSHRYLGVLKEQSRIAMMELLRRQNLGDNFNFLNYIDEKLKEMPSLSKEKDNNIISSILNQIKNEKY